MYCIHDLQLLGHMTYDMVKSKMNDEMWSKFRMTEMRNKWKTKEMNKNNDFQKRKRKIFQNTLFSREMIQWVLTIQKHRNKREYFHTSLSLILNLKSVSVAS